MSINENLIKYIILKKIRNCPNPELSITHEELSKELSITEDELVKLLNELCVDEGFIQIDNTTLKEISLRITKEGKEFLKEKRTEVEDYVLKTIDNSKQINIRISPIKVSETTNVLIKDTSSIILNMVNQGLIEKTADFANGTFLLKITDSGRKRIEGSEEEIFKIEPKITVNTIYGSIFSQNQDVTINQTINIEQLNQNVDRVINEINNEIQKDDSIKDKKNSLNKIKQLGYHLKEIYRILASIKDSKVFRYAIKLIKKMFGIP